MKTDRTIRSVPGKSTCGGILPSALIAVAAVATFAAAPAYVSATLLRNGYGA